MASDCSSFIRGEPERWRRQEPEPFAGEMDTPITRDGNRWIDWRNESTASTVFNPDRDRMFVEEVAREFAGIEFKMQSLCGADCQLACLKAFLLPPSPPPSPLVADIRVGMIPVRIVCWWMPRWANIGFDEPKQEKETRSTEWQIKKDANGNMAAVKSCKSRGFSFSKFFTFQIRIRVNKWNSYSLMIGSQTKIVLKNGLQPSLLDSTGSLRDLGSFSQVALI